MTNFQYTPTIPDGPNNPSVDQPGMKINAQSINDILAIDHVTFNADNGGTHKQVVFSSNNVPSLPATFPTLFTNTVSGLPQIFFYSGSEAQSSNQYSSASNFSTFLLGGLILKGGSITLSASPQVINYASLSPAISAFINNTLAVFITPTNPAGVTSSSYISSVNASSFTITQRNPVTSPSFYFLAIGF